LKLQYDETLSNFAFKFNLRHYGVDRLVEVRSGKLHAYKGNYTKFMEERSKNRKVAQAAAGPRNPGFRNPSRC
jgi:hypothetical protein